MSAATEGTSATVWSAEQIRQRARALGPWFHNLELSGVGPAPEHFLGDYPMVKWRRCAHAIPADLRGKTGVVDATNTAYALIMYKML